MKTAVEAICVLGRGIERVGTNRGDVWRPTRYIEVLSTRGAHLGRRVRGIDINGEHSVIAGANANVVAACQLFEELRNSGRAPRLVIFAAGRPSYLLDESDKNLTEGRILSEHFTRKVQPKSGETDIIILKHNRDTKDDIDEILKVAARRDVNKVTIVTVAVHLARAAEFARVACQGCGTRVDLNFMASEQLLVRRYARSNHFTNVLRLCEQSAAYMRTASEEQRGIEAIRSGTYRRTR